jgi:hypothetical protein
MRTQEKQSVGKSWRNNECFTRGRESLPYREDAASPSLCYQELRYTESQSSIFPKMAFEEECFFKVGREKWAPLRSLALAVQS